MKSKSPLSKIAWLVFSLVSATSVFSVESIGNEFLGAVEPSAYGCNLEAPGIAGYVFASEYKEGKWTYRININDAVVLLQKENGDVNFPEGVGANSTMKFKAKDISAVLTVTYVKNDGEGTDAYMPSYQGTLEVTVNGKRQAVKVKGICGS